MIPRILCVDDDPGILAGFSRNLQGKFSVSTEQSGRAAIECMRRHPPFQVVLSDMEMPGMNGLEFLATVQKHFPDTVRIMLTGNADVDTASMAVNKGQVFRFLTKPCKSKNLVSTIHEAVTHYRLLATERDLLDRTLKGTIKMLMEVMASIDHASFGHGERIREPLREYLSQFPVPNAYAVESAAMLSQIGRVAIPPLVLVKRATGRRLEANELDMLARIPKFGADLLSNIPRLDEVAEILRYQKKNYDGSGNPTDSVSETEIPLGARILRIFLDLSERESRGTIPKKVFAELRLRKGIYDPQILEDVESVLAPSTEPKQQTGTRTEKRMLKDLCPGQILAGNVKTLTGTLVASTGVCLSRMAIQKIENFHELENVKQPILVQVQSEPVDSQRMTPKAGM